MGILQRLAVVISGDDKGGVTAAERSAVAMEKASVAQAKLTVAGDRLSVAEAKVGVIEAKAAGDAEALSAATATLTAAQERLAASTAAAGVAQAQAGYAQAERSLQGVTKAAQDSTVASRALGPIAGASSATLVAGAAAGVLAEEKLAQSFSDTTEEVRKFRDISGTTTDEASRFRAMFVGLGVPVDTADTAVGRLAKTLGNTPAALDKYGVAVARNKNGTVDLGQTLLSVADRYNALEDPTQRAALAQAAFGRGYTELIPVLRANRDALKEFGDAAARRGEVFSDADIQKGADFAIQMREAKAALEAVGHQFGGAAAGSFTDLARVVNTAASGTALLVHWMNEGKDAVDRWVARLIPHIPIVEKFAKALLGGSDAAKTLAQSGAATAGVLDGIDASASEASQSLDGLVGAVQSYMSATDKIVSTNEALAKAHDEIAKKAQDETAATDAATKANDDLKTAQEALSKAQRDAPGNLARAHSDAAKAVDAEAKAVDAVTVAIERYGARSKQAKAAQDDLTAARLDTTDAATKAADLEAAGNRPPDVAAAEERVASAKREQADAAAAKTKADQEDPIGDIAKAEQAVKDASLEELITRSKLNDAIATYNSTFGASVTLADVLNGKADDFLRKILEGSTALGQANADASTLNARIQAANDAAIGAGIVDPTGYTAGPGTQSTTANPAPKPGLLQRAGDFIANVTINVTGATASATDIADAASRSIASLARSRAS